MRKIRKFSVNMHFREDNGYRFQVIEKNKNLLENSGCIHL